MIASFFPLSNSALHCAERITRQYGFLTGAILKQYSVLAYITRQIRIMALEVHTSPLECRYAREFITEYPFRFSRQGWRCFDYAEVELSNNLAENSMRPVALGRKNWLHVSAL